MHIGTQAKSLPALVFTRSEKAVGHGVGRTRKQNFSRVTEARFLLQPKWNVIHI